jgi:hypothetical protein
MLSLDAVDQFINSGSYREMKRLHNKLQVLKNSIRTEQEKLQKKADGLEEGRSSRRVSLFTGLRL